MSQVAVTRVGEMVVSTIRRSPKDQRLDSLLAVMAERLGFHEGADIDAPGEYETMVFAGADWDNADQTLGLREYDFRRYETEEEARRGHQEMVEKWAEMPSIPGDTRGE